MKPRRPRLRHRVWPALLAAFLSLSAAILLFWPEILNGLGGFLIKSQAPLRSDLIVVLGGDFWGPRVLKGAELGRAGYAPLVLISGPPYRSWPEGELAVGFLESKGYSNGMFEVFAHNGSSTWTEAMALRDELRRRHARRVIFVTSAYHSRRAAIALKIASPGVDFLSVPAPDSEYRPDHWWTDAGSSRLFWSEWSKIAGTLLMAPRVVIAWPE